MPIIDRLQDVGDPVMHTDCHRAYPNIAGRLHNVTHETVNHSQNFKDPVSGVHTNNVEGIHATLKKDSRTQFGRLPSVRNGHVHYLDLVVWRTHARLRACEQGTDSQFLVNFLLALRDWHKEPLDSFDPAAVMTLDASRR